MEQTLSQTTPRWKRILFSDAMLTKTKAQKIAAIGIMAALCIVANMFLEFKFGDVQFSLTLYISVLSGILIGPVFGFVAVFLGDLVGFLYNNWGALYLPWIGLSCAAMAVIAGLVMHLPLHFRGSLYVKLAAICVLVLLVCSVGISTTGFYLYYTKVGFSQAAMQTISEQFGTEVTYFGYVVYRLFFGGQIWNSLFNYALLFLTLPVLAAIKPLRLDLH